ncbi:hypothetical protein [Pseudonocardia sp. T1-2H]|uniref:hypothetical protein n=1 Tax=Pseudonocardia sp. T1-2H TaxID=3128899 RepID=UPI0031018AE5
MPDDLDDLARQLSGAVGSLTEAEILEAVRQAEEIHLASRARSGRLLAELHGRGLSWPAIARATGLSQTTAYQWAQPYLMVKDPE